MPEIIASTYEVIRKIGAGGGGNVYLAKHLRLNKMVVLKADKRKVTTKPQLLRREVDVLKNLRHPYIPQVYDFFVEDDIVYTAMDYVKGESLDMPLKRGEHFSQAQVITWAIQLLQALAYLHSPIHGDPPKGFIHSDVKPANLMLTPDGSICLIDFNISLALGEENIVGRSAGYASPEHYGVDFSGNITAATTQPTESPIRPTIYVPGGEVTEPADYNPSTSLSSNASPFSGTSRLKKVVPDVRSDIYSTGATLYHLLSGHRPARNALEVVSLSAQEFSPQIVAIITKAMSPNPQLRYQTAEEMLDAFLHLRDNDPRARRLKKGRRIGVTALLGLLCLGTAVSFTGLKRMQTTESWLKYAGYSHEALQNGDVDTALADAIRAYPQKKSIFTPTAPPQAQNALTGALAVYDLADSYKANGTISLPAAPLYVSLSPDGTTAACIYANTLAVIDTTARAVTATFPADSSALSEVEYINSDTIAYAGAGNLCVYSISQGKTLWQGKPATGLCVSADGKHLAAIYRDEGYATVYSTDGNTEKKIDFGGRQQQVVANDVFANPNDNLLALNKDGTLLAVSFSDGSLQLFDLTAADNNKIILQADSGYAHFEGGFSGKYFAFSASGSANSIFAVLDTATMEQTGGYQSQDMFSVQTNEDGIFVGTENILVRIDPVSGDQTPLVTTAKSIQAFAENGVCALISTPDSFEFYDSAATLISSCELPGTESFVCLAGNVALLANRNDTSLRLLTYQSHPEAQAFHYDSTIEHDEVRFAADRKTVMLFNYKTFYVFTVDGHLLCKTELPDADLIYDQQFRRNGAESYLEVIYNDGTIRKYDARDGAMLSQEHGSQPDRTLYEEFATQTMRVESPLHGTPVVYDLKTGHQIAELNSDDYLTYFIQAGPYVIAQYMTAEGTYYGQLLNSDCEVLAELPSLCDVIEEELYFDYPTGDVRKTHIYYIEDLIKKYTEQEKG